MDLWVFLSILNFPFKPVFGLKPKMCIWTKLALPGRPVLMKKCPLRHCNDLLAAPVITALSPLLILTVISGAGALLTVVMTQLGIGGWWWGWWRCPVSTGGCLEQLPTSLEVYSSKSPMKGSPHPELGEQAHSPSHWNHLLPFHAVFWELPSKSAPILPAL